MNLMQQLNDFCADAREFQELQENKKEQKKQEQLYQYLSGYAQQCQVFVQNLKEAKEKLGFAVPRETLDDMKGQIEIVLERMEYGLEQDDLQEIGGVIKTCKSETQSSWKKFYSSLKKEKKAALAPFKSMNPGFYTSCISKLDGKDTFFSKSDDIEVLRQVLRSINEQLVTLNLDDEIKEFLLKVNAGQATYSDLTPSICHWIEEGNMGKKIKVSFG